MFVSGTAGVANEVSAFEKVDTLHTATAWAGQHTDAPAVIRPSGSANFLKREPKIKFENKE